MQDVFLRAYNTLRDNDRPITLRPWLYRVAHNRCIDQLRRPHPEPEAVFDALADARTYPEWWTPVYLDVDADGPPDVGRTSRQRFTGRLPYKLNTQSTITRLERPHLIEADVVGDLRGRGLWTLCRLGVGHCSGGHRCCDALPADGAPDQHPCDGGQCRSVN